MYGGVDQLTDKEIRLRKTVSARSTRRETEREAVKVQTRLLNQVDERCSPRTEATVNELLDRWLDILDVERKTRAGYVSKIEKHLRPTIARLQVGRMKAETIDGLYARLRRCRDHCRGEKYIQHRTGGEHVCDEHSPRRRCAQVTFNDPSAYCRWCERACRQHRCTPLSASSIRAILSGAFGRAVRWGAIAVNPIDATDPPPLPRPNPSPPTAAEAAALLTEAWADPDWGTLVMFAMTTGARRGEICGLRWAQLDPTTGSTPLSKSSGSRSPPITARSSPPCSRSVRRGGLAARHSR